MLDGFPTRAAWALCTFAYSAGPGTEPILFEGRTDGKIVPARGPPKFGWDPVFEAENTGLTYVCSISSSSSALCPSRADGSENTDVITSFTFLLCLVFLIAMPRWRRNRRILSHIGAERWRNCGLICSRRKVWHWPRRSAGYSNHKTRGCSNYKARCHQEKRYTGL
jgi:hypothetical protein